MRIEFLGHACFLVKEAEAELIFDPFLEGNPQATVKPAEVSAKYILVSHAHHDHLGNAVQIAKANAGVIISTAEVAKMCSEQGARTEALHLGGKRDFPFGRVRLVPAFHGAGVAGGHACGFVVRLGTGTLYFAGDTGVFGDMELIARLEPIDVALLPIGDNYTMGADDALLAVKMLKPRLVVPMHYDTWPVIRANPDAFKRMVEAETDSRVHILKPGEGLDFKK